MCICLLIIPDLQLHLPSLQCILSLLILYCSIMSSYIPQLFWRLTCHHFFLLNYQKKILVMIFISESVTKLASSCRINHPTPFGKLVDKFCTLDSMMLFLNCYLQGMIQDKKKTFIHKGSITLSSTAEKSWKQGETYL